MSKATLYRPIVMSVENKSNGNRGTDRYPMANSAAIYFGSLFDPFTGTDGAQTPAANQKIRGVVRGIVTAVGGGNFQDVTEAVTVPGTLTAATASLPAKYTTASDNATTRKDWVEYDLINVGDVVRVTLSNGSGVPVRRGTTAASAVLNNYIEFDDTYPYMMLESSANSSASGKNWQIVGFPRNPYQLDVRLINSDGAVS